MFSDSRAAIVVIDDDGSVFERNAAILAQRHYQVHYASSPEEGLDLAAAMKPAFVVIGERSLESDAAATMKAFREESPDTSLLALLRKRSIRKTADLTAIGVAACLSPSCSGHNLADRFDDLAQLRELRRSAFELARERDDLRNCLEDRKGDAAPLVRKKTGALQKANAVISRTEKLAAMGFLAAGMAHDIRNPLNTISLFTQLMRQNETDTESSDYLGKIIREVEKIDSMLKRMLEVSRRSRISASASNIQLDRVVDMALELFEPQTEVANVRVTRNFQKGLPPVKADPGEMEQAFTNLFLNALDEMPNGGRLEVQLLVENNMVVARVGDSGRGIPEQALPNVFEPFFTTKPRGAGMGLPVVKRIARIYGGSVAVERTEATGTVIRLEFPASPEAGAAAPELVGRNSVSS